MIKLTKPDGKPFYVNAEYITTTSLKCEGETRIYVGSTIDDCFIVTESPEQVVRKIMEYKIRTIQYEQYLQDALMGGDWGKTKESKNALFHLAGLEDNQDG